MKMKKEIIVENNVERTFILLIITGFVIYSETIFEEL